MNPKINKLVVIKDQNCFDKLSKIIILENILKNYNHLFFKESLILNLLLNTYRGL